MKAKKYEAIFFGVMEDTEIATFYDTLALAIGQNIQEGDIGMMWPETVKEPRKMSDKRISIITQLLVDRQFKTKGDGYWEKVVGNICYIIFLNDSDGCIDYRSKHKNSIKKEETKNTHQKPATTNTSKKDQILSLLSEGKKVSEIMKIVGCGDAYVYAIKKELKG